MPLNVYDRVLNRIEKYALVFSAVVLFFIIVSTVFSTSIMRVGDRDMVLEKPKSGAAQYRSADSSAPDNGFSFIVSC